MYNEKKLDTRFQLHFKVNEEGQLLREFLHSKGISKRTLTATKYDGGQILVNGNEQNVRHRLQADDKVAIYFPKEVPSAGLCPENGQLDIRYEDETILIINKPAGQATIPSRDHPNGTVANFVAGKFEKENLPATVHVVTRLDRDTSGLICIAKNRHIHHLLSEQMMTSGFYRQYIAVIEGHLENKPLTIEAPIGRQEGSIIERTVRKDGQFAKTEVEVLEQLTVNGHLITSVALVLQTGRTHQIRVHMQWAGHPLVGDDLYGGSMELMARQALHCATIGFLHPISREEIMFTSEIPADMESLITQKR